MRTSTLFALIVMNAYAIAQADGETEVPVHRIDAFDLERGKDVVIGKLREPLGVQQTVAGTCIEPMNGVKINNSLFINSSKIGAWGSGMDLEIRGIVVEKGKRYRLQGYESAEFVGSADPNALSKASPSNLRFRTFFVVTRVLETFRSSDHLGVAEIQVTFAAQQTVPSEGIPKEARHAGVGLDVTGPKDATTKIEFGEVKDPSDHGALSRLVDGKIPALNVTWADQQYFKHDEKAAAEFLRQVLGDPMGNSYTFQVWSQGLQLPILTADVEHLGGKSGKLLIWKSGDTNFLCVYQNGVGKWWFCSWDGVNLGDGKQ